MDAGLSRAALDAIFIGTCVEEAHVLEQRPREELVILQNGANHLAETAGADLSHGHAANQDLPGLRFEQPIMIFSSVVFPHPEGPVIATDSPGEIGEIHAVEHVTARRRRSGSEYPAARWKA